MRSLSFSEQILWTLHLLTQTDERGQVYFSQEGKKAYLRKKLIFSLYLSFANSFLLLRACGVFFLLAIETVRLEINFIARENCMCIFFSSFAYTAIFSWKWIFTQRMHTWYTIWCTVWCTSLSISDVQVSLSLMILLLLQYFHLRLFSAVFYFFAS